MTDWSSLPWLLTSAQVRQITGHCRKKLYQLERDGVLHARRDHAGPRKYYRIEVMRYVGASK